MSAVGLSIRAMFFHSPIVLATALTGCGINSSFVSRIPTLIHRNCELTMILLYSMIHEKCSIQNCLPGVMILDKTTRTGRDDDILVSFEC